MLITWQQDCSEGVFNITNHNKNLRCRNSNSINNNNNLSRKSKDPNNNNINISYKNNSHNISSHNSHYLSNKIIKGINNKINKPFHPAGDKSIVRIRISF